MKAEWLDRSVMCCPYYCLCLSQEAFDEAIEGTTLLRAPYLSEGKQAKMWSGKDQNGKRICIVCLSSEEAKASRPIVIAGLLVHEAVHIWQQYIDDIGETNESHEFEAYSIQWIAQNLMWSYCRQMGHPEPP